MKKLIKENIQFIDNYLLKSGVIYKDIRVEMIDHVASAVEERMQTNNAIFYDAFKGFMVENKKSLLEGQDVFIKQIRNSLFKAFLGKLFSINKLVLSIIVYSLHYFLYPLFKYQDHKRFFLIYFIGILGIAALYVRIKNGFNLKEKYSALGILFSYHLLIWFPWQILATSIQKIDSKPKMFLAYTILTVVTFTYWQIAGIYVEKYNKKYSYA